MNGDLDRSKIYSVNGLSSTSISIDSSDVNILGITYPSTTHGYFLNQYSYNSQNSAMNFQVLIVIIQIYM